MAAPGEWISARDENKRELHRSSVSEHEKDGINICVRAVIESLVEFGTKLNVSDDVLSIRFNVSGVETSSLQLSHVQNCLQQHISKLQSVAENLKKIANSVDRPDPGSQESTLEFHKKTLDTTEEIVVDAERVPSTSQHTQAKVNKSTSADNVQITAGKSEIERRISAFIERKQLEINENNVREFCNVIDCNQEDSCARTDAVFTPFPGFKSHVKVTRVVNTYGPQTRGVELGDQNQGSVRDCGNPAIEERLHNMESHLKLPVGPVPRGVYQRLKKLEDRILELEGLSPEYFHSTNYSHKRPKASMAQSYTLAELDGKINAVKAALLKRTRTFQPTDAGDFFY